MPNDVTYSPAEICEMFDIAKSTLFRWEGEGWFPRVGRTLTGERQYTQEQIMAISEKLRRQLGKQYERLAEVEAESQLEKLSEAMSFLKFLQGNDTGLYELAEYENPTPQRIRQLLLTAIKQYEPGDPTFTDIMDVATKQSKKLSLATR